MKEEIARRAYRPLEGKRILLGLTGSSAVYRSVDLARLLIRLGAEVRVVLSRTASKFIGPDLLHWAVGHRPYIEMTGETEHIDLATWADVMVIAPATLNAMSKIAHGIADELIYLTAITLMGSGKKLIVVPTMNLRLFRAPQYEASSKTLREYNVTVIPPYVEEDKVKFPPLEDLAFCIEAVVNRGEDLGGVRALVTTGPTREYIDPVRVITNPSSGLMGAMISREIACRGGAVDLVHGPVSVPLPYMVNKHGVETTAEMAQKVRELSASNEYDAAVFAAAPADYTPDTRSEIKIPTTSRPELSLRLVTTPKVASSLARRPKVLVGFAAETASGDELIAKAREKYERYGFDLLIANDVSRKNVGFGSEYLSAVVIARGEVVKSGLLHKHEISRLIADFIKSNK